MLIVFAVVVAVLVVSVLSASSANLSAVRQHVLQHRGRVDSFELPVEVDESDAQLAFIQEELEHGDTLAAVPTLLRVVLVGNLSVSSEFELKRGSAKLRSDLQRAALEQPHEQASIDRVLRADWVTEQHRVPSVYVFHSGVRAPYLDSSGASTLHRCGYAHGVALDDESRFAWLDLSVQGVSFGPMTIGDGGEYGMSESLDDQVALASFLYQAHAQLVAPRPVREPLVHAAAETTSVSLILIRDHHGAAYDTAALERALNAVDLLPEQRVRVALGVAYELHECAECQIAIDLATVTADSQHFLDSRLLVDAFERFELAGRNAADVVLYLLDFQRLPLRLLDAKHFAVPMPARVVAVQAALTAAPLVQIDYFCAGHPALAVPSNDSSSAIYAALLTTLFGIGPAETHLFDMFRSPFGPLAAAAARPLAPPHFGIRDAAARFQIVASLNVTHRVVGHALERFQLYLHDATRALSQSEAHVVARRWALFRYKREQLLHSLAVHDTADALAFLRALQFDAKAITATLQSAAERLGAQLICSSPSAAKPTAAATAAATESFWFFVNVVTLIVVVVVVVSNCRRTLFPSATTTMKKRF